MQHDFDTYKVKHFEALCLTIKHRPFTVQHCVGLG